MVFVADGEVIFLRRTPANAPAIAACEVTAGKLDVGAYMRHCRQSDPWPACGLKGGAETLQWLGWLEQAAQVWRACIEADPQGEFHEARLNLGVCLAQRGEEMFRSGTPGYSTLLREARQCFQQALALKPDYEPAQKNLRLVEQRLAGTAAGE
jgi:tetratricopeptide (TPR) repeat protein